MSERIVCNIRRCIICFVFESVSDNFARQIFDDVLIMRGVAVDDQSTVSREFFCEQTERMTDIVNVFKEIQMIGVHVQDDADLREEA